MHSEWRQLLADQRDALASIETKVKAGAFQPKADLVMRAFEHSADEVKVVIIGQDPYPNPRHAIGLAFAVPIETRPLPPTLRNIYAELASDLGVELELAQRADLSAWSDQGVMLLNRHLTTSPGASLAHEKLGWKEFTDHVVLALCSSTKQSPIFVLWGSEAQQLKTFMQPGMLAICTPHPSPLSAYRGFFGSRPFSQINAELIRRGQTAINWLHA